MSSDQRLETKKRPRDFSPGALRDDLGLRQEGQGCQPQHKAIGRERDTRLRSANLAPQLTQWMIIDP
jgi:hypothetical protein